MNYCQVEVDTARYYKERDAQEAAEEAAAEEAEAKVMTEGGEYFWASKDNMNEAISEKLGAMGTEGRNFETTLAQLVKENKGDELVRFLKDTSINYWTAYLMI